MTVKTRYNERVADIAQRASKMRTLCIDSQFDAKTNSFITDAAQRVASVNPCEIDAMFEAVSDKHARQIVSAAQSAIADYVNIYGCEPRDEMLASAHKSIEAMLTLAGHSKEGNQCGMMLEAIGESLSTSEGVELRAKMIALILPTLLSTATSDAVTFMPAANDELEIFKVFRTAGTSFGDFHKGQVIDDRTVGQYSQMRQRFAMAEAQQPDGTKKQYVFTSSTDLQNTSIDIPMRKGSVSIFVNHKRVARDMDAQDGHLFGADDKIVYTGSIDYAKGIITVSTNTALLDTDKIDVEFECDIEQKPELIPLIDHEMTSKKVTPSQSAIASEATIQAMFAMQREYGIDIRSMQMSHMKNLLGAERACRQLSDMNYACTRTTEFNSYCPAGFDWKLQRELLREKLLNVSQLMLESNKVSGLVGLYCGVNMSTFIKSLGAPYFVPAPNYVQTNKIHYCGMLFGMWRVFEAPVIIGKDEALCYGRGQNHSEAGYISGDAVAPTMYQHPIGSNLRSRNTLWELSFNEVHPFGGENFFYRVKLVNIPTEAIKIECTHTEAPVAEKNKKISK